jgi:hypothetical protein
MDRACSCQLCSKTTQEMLHVSKARSAILETANCMRDSDNCSGQDRYAVLIAEITSYFVTTLNSQLYTSA